MVSIFIIPSVSNYRLIIAIFIYANLLCLLWVYRRSIAVISWACAKAVPSIKRSCIVKGSKGGREGASLSVIYSKFCDRVERVWVT